MSELLHDVMFWYGIAFVIFCGLAYWKARKPMVGWIDSEIAKIREELARVKQLRQEAEATLATYQKKHAEAMLEAEQIIRYAQQEAKELKQQAEADLKATLARHEQQAAERIRLAETEAMAAVRSAVVDAAMSSAREALEEQAENSSKLTDQAIAELPKLAAGKAKAA